MAFALVLTLASVAALALAEASLGVLSHLLLYAIHPSDLPDVEDLLELLEVVCKTVE